jgi:hypothetical protein
MSRSFNYAEVTDAAPLLGLMGRHADEGLPFLSLQYDDYQEWTQKGTSTMPSLDVIEASNLEGTNALEPAAYRHLLSISTKIVGLDFGNGNYGVSIRTSDGRNVSVVPTTRSIAYRPFNETERKIFEADMGKTNKMEPIGEVLEAFGVEPKPKDEL